MSPPAPTAERVLAGDAVALARTITLAERGHPAANGLLAELRRHGGSAYRVVVAGPPGVGKSSLLREVARRLRAGGERTAIIALDPVSPLSGGALLGDRFRLAALGEDRGLFFRSLAHRGTPGELPPAAFLAADVLDAASFPWLFIESVGTGQAEVQIYRGAHLKVLVLSPESGDSVQMMKAGLLEAADLHLVNKCDRPGGAAWAAELAATLAAGGERQPCVLSVSAATGEGVDELAAELRRRREAWAAGQENREGEREREGERDKA